VGIAAGRPHHDYLLVYAPRLVHQSVDGQHTCAHKQMSRDILTKEVHARPESLKSDLGLKSEMEDIIQGAFKYEIKYISSHAGCRRKATHQELLAGNPARYTHLRK